MLGLVLLSALSATAAQAAPKLPADLPKAFAGHWRISTGDGAHRCDLMLGAAKAGKGFAIAQQKPCGDAFPLQSMTAWKPYGGMIVFLSETGVRCRPSPETEEGLYMSAGDPVYFLRFEPR